MPCGRAAMATGGWPSALIGAIGLIVGLFAVARLRRLRRRAQRLGVAPRASRRAERVLRTWGSLFLLVAAGFLFQENLEHLAAHGHLIGTGALASPEYPLALPVIAAVTLVAGIVVGLLRSTESALVEAISSALAAFRGPGSPPASGHRECQRRTSIGPRPSGRLPGASGGWVALI